MNKEKAQLTDSRWKVLLKFNTFGRSSYVSLEGLLDKVFHPSYISFFVIVCILHALFDVGRHGTVELYWFHIIQVNIYLVFVFTTINVLEAFSIYLAKRFEHFFIYAPLIVITSVCISSFLLVFASEWLPGNPISMSVALQRLPVQIAIAVVLQALYDLFVIPVVTGNQGRRKAETESTSPMISIAGKQFVAKDLYSLSASDHYLEVKTITETHFLRSRLADAVLQLELVDGIMPHRSFWVARFAISKIDTDYTPKVLMMTDGSEIPIAHARFSEIKDWL